MTDDWAEIKEAFCARMPLGEIRARFGVSLAELLARAKTDGWKWGQSDASLAENMIRAPNGAGGEPAPLAVHFTPAVSATIEAVVCDTATAIAESHKSIARKLRARLELELAEFDEAAQNFASFRDTDHIARLVAKDDDGKELRFYLAQCLANHEKRTSVLERFGRIGAQIIGLERLVWSLDIEPDHTERINWDAVLAEIRKPLKPLSLPNNVIEFERRMAIKDRQAE